MTKQPRCVTLFEERCKSEVTTYVYKQNLDRFLDWAHKDYESLLVLPKQEIEDLLTDYMIHLKKIMSPNSLQTPFSAIFKFLKANRVKFDREHINELKPTRVKPGGERKIIDDELQIMIRVAPDSKHLALLHILAATGCRPEAVAHNGVSPDLEPGAKVTLVVDLIGDIVLGNDPQVVITTNSGQMFGGTIVAGQQSP